jgi:hypothetical protein
LNGLASILRRSAARQQQDAGANHTSDNHDCPHLLRGIGEGADHGKKFAKRQCRQMRNCVKAWTRRM